MSACVFSLQSDPGLACRHAGGSGEVVLVMAEAMAVLVVMVVDSEDNGGGGDVPEGGKVVGHSDWKPISQE